LKEIAGYMLFLVGDILLASKAKSILDWLEVGIDFVATLATNIVPLLGEWGNVSVPTAFYGAISKAMWIMAGAEGLITSIREGNWFLKTGATLLAQTLRLTAGGPIALIGSLLMMFVQPIIGNLLDIGAHALLASGFGDYQEYQRQEQMPIQTWCAQYGGCPKEL